MEVARAADGQATILRQASKQRAKLQLLEAETRAEIPKEGQGRERVLWEAAYMWSTNTSSSISISIRINTIINIIIHINNNTSISIRISIHVRASTAIADG